MILVFDTHYTVSLLQQTLYTSHNKFSSWKRKVFVCNSDKVNSRIKKKVVQCFQKMIRFNSNWEKNCTVSTENLKVLHLSSQIEISCNGNFNPQRSSNYSSRIATPLRRIVFLTISYHLKTFFNFKDRLPNGSQSFVIYNSSYGQYTSMYTGETSCHISTRIEEHKGWFIRDSARNTAFENPK